MSTIKTNTLVCIYYLYAIMNLEPFRTFKGYVLYKANMIIVALHILHFLVILKIKIKLKLNNECRGTISDG